MLDTQMKLTSWQPFHVILEIYNIIIHPVPSLHTMNIDGCVIILFIANIFVLCKQYCLENNTNIVIVHWECLINMIIYNFVQTILFGK